LEQLVEQCPRRPEALALDQLIGLGKAVAQLSRDGSGSSRRELPGGFPFLRHDVSPPWLTVCMLLAVIIDRDDGEPKRFSRQAAKPPSRQAAKPRSREA